MRKKGFTLVELLAVIAILAILVIIALPNIINMYNNARKNSFLTEAKSVFSQSTNKYMTDSLGGSSSSTHIYCRSNTDSLNPLDLTGRKVNYYIRTDGSGNANTVVVWDDTRYVAKKGTKLEGADLDDALDITDDIKNATCDNILDKTGLEKKIEYNFTTSDLIIAADDKIVIKFNDSSDLSKLSSVKYRVYIQSNNDRNYNTETLLTTTDIISSDASNKFRVEIDNPATTISPWTYVFRVEVYDNSNNKVIEKSYTETYCFVAGTKVLTESGYKNIEDIKIGDKVYSYNLDSNKLELKKVTNTITSSTKDTFKVTIDGKVVEMSPKHQIYIIDKGYVRAYDLKVGDRMLSSDNKVIEIENIEYKVYEESIPTYNLTIEGNSNYFVSEIQVLVHNAGSPT